MNAPITEGQLIEQIRNSLNMLSDDEDMNKERALEKLAALDNLTMARVMREHPMSILRESPPPDRAVLKPPITNHELGASLREESLRGCINLGVTAILAFAALRNHNPVSEHITSDTIAAIVTTARSMQDFAASTLKP